MTTTHTALAAAIVGLTGLLLWAYWMTRPEKGGRSY